MLHWHHIVPKHAGGSDDPSNLVQLTLEEHAEAHRKLYEEHGRWQDMIAYKTLSGQISIQEAREYQLKHENPMHKPEVLKKVSGENHWSKKEEHKNKKLFGEINPMHKPEVIVKMSGDNHWSKRTGKIHNAKVNHPKGSSKKIKVNNVVYASIKEASISLGWDARKVRAVGTLV